MQDILTEQEAKMRWCPMVRVESEGSQAAGVNRGIDGNSCIASQCMAWRLAHKDAADGTERGYCGAFGLPRFT